ncbi:hypothetical protein CEV32_4561 [Brucella rhizosphaerae]|uniref:Uncharacterized protein n=1 Tax=Brucella rhizosphaerae TaxID=571254 RepID=A0A256FKD6_9HYPH|nr:hypothetical protein CEV32_4561 [Brucella rhizosphaerae]
MFVFTHIFSENRSTLFEMRSNFIIPAIDVVYQNDNYLELNFIIKEVALGMA